MTVMRIKEVTKGALMVWNTKHVNYKNEWGGGGGGVKRKDRQTCDGSSREVAKEGEDFVT